MRHIILIGLLAAPAMACQDSAAPVDTVSPSPSEASHRAPLNLRRERARLIAAGNALSSTIASQGVTSGLARAFTHDVLFLSPRVNLVQGRAAAVGFLSSDPLAPRALDWNVIAADVSNDGTQGFTWSQGSSTFDFGTGAEPRPSIFLIYWRRPGGGDWKVAAMTINAGGPHVGGLPEGFGTPTTKHRQNLPHTNRDQASAQVLRVDARFSAASVAQGSGPAFERFAAPNAMAVSGPNFVFGPEAIGVAFSSEPGDIVSWVPRFSDAAPTGDLAYTVGEAIFELSVGTFYSKYLTVWQRQDTGRWKWVADFGNSRPAPAP